MRKKNEYGSLVRNDHRLDLSPAGRNLFVTREKEIQRRQASRLRFWMKIVLGIVLAAGAVVAGILALVYFVPRFREEVSISAAADDASKSASLEEVPLYDEMGLPVYGREVSLFVINPQHPAGEEDEPPQLEEIAGVTVDARIVPALRMMLAGAAEDGVELKFAEGYVSYREQEKRFEDKVKTLSEEEGLSTVMARLQASQLEPKPGESDFQTGLCLRLSAKEEEDFASTQAYSWLRQNMGKYGFVFRYPRYSRDYTGMEEDPTVIRYVGWEEARAMTQRGMCLEEYLDYLDTQ